MTALAVAPNWFRLTPCVTETQQEIFAPLSLLVGMKDALPWPAMT